jgi:hypothetical protein
MLDNKTPDSKRYMVLGYDGTPMYYDTKSEVENHIQSLAPRRVAVYQLRYVSEAVLCSVGYEDEATDVDNGVKVDE